MSERIAWNRGILRVKREIRTCAAPDCNITFECRVNSTKKYCCAGHSHKGKSSWNRGKKLTAREVRICVNLKCNNTFEIIVTSTKKYCCRKCYCEVLSLEMLKNNRGLKDGRSKRKGKEGSRRIKREIRICAYPSCSNTFECRVNSTKKYCCGSCYYKTFSLEGAKEERSRKKRIALRDPVYRKQVIQAAHKANAARWFDPEARQKQSLVLIKAYKSGARERRSGENSPSWKGGISNRPYPFEFDEELTESIRERDNHTCQFCGKTQEEEYRKLSVHHIDYDKDNLDRNNLITLCASCNIKANFNREYWTKFFSQKLKEMDNGNSYTNLSTM